MSANLYASVAEFRDRMGITDTESDWQLDRALQTASRWIDQTLGRRFYTTESDEIRYYTASDCYWELRPEDDILSITTLATDANGDGVYETTWTTGTDYHLEPINAVANGEPYRRICRSWWQGRFSFPSYHNAVKVTGKFGYCALVNVPPQITTLCMMVAEGEAGPGLSDLVIPGVQSYKIGNELTVTVAGKNLPRSAQSIIDHYRRGVGFIG
jgi:hypothetical protein